MIERGLFTYKDAKSDVKFSVGIDHLAAKIPGFDEPLQLEFEGAFDDKPFKLKGTVGPIWAWVEPGYVLPADITVSAGGATARIKGEMRDPTHFKDLAFTITAKGSLSDKRLVHRFSDHGMDGMRCDVDGNLYITRHGKGTVIKMTPEGEILREILT